MKFAIVIPARKNSKSVRNKNRFKINGKPLIEYTLKQSHLSKIKLKFIISDDEKIKKISKKYKFNTEYVRPKHTSTDKSSTVDTLIHFVKSTMNKYDYDYLVVLQATSPLRSYQDINRSVEMIKKEKSLSLFSISESLEHPYETIVLQKNKKWKYLLQNACNFYRRQDFNLKTFFINGAIYIVSKKHLLKSKKIYSKNHSLYKMPKNRSLDINDYDDIELAKKIL
jgi:CMP-N,N'-diacetyllegionaminic acid synthase